MRSALLALRRFPVKRYGNTARDAYRPAVCGSSCVYHSYSSFARVSADSEVPKMRCFSASYGSFSGVFAVLASVQALQVNPEPTFRKHRANSMVQIGITSLQRSVFPTPRHHLLNKSLSRGFFRRERTQNLDQPLCRTRPLVSKPSSIQLLQLHSFNSLFRALPSVSSLPPLISHSALL